MFVILLFELYSSSSFVSYETGERSYILLKFMFKQSRVSRLRIGCKYLILFFDKLNN